MNLALGVWFLVVALVARLPRGKGWVVLLGALAMVWLIPPQGIIEPSRGFIGAWLLLALAIRQNGLQSRWMGQSILHGVVALVTVLLLRRWESLLDASTLPSFLVVPTLWMCGGGLILVGWHLCCQLHGWYRSLDYPLWVGSLGLAIAAPSPLH